MVKSGLEARLLTALESSWSALCSDVLAHLEIAKRESIARLGEVENVAAEQATTRVAEMEEDILTRLENADVSVLFNESVGGTLVFHGWPRLI